MLICYYAYLLICYLLICYYVFKKYSVFKKISPPHSEVRRARISFFNFIIF